MKKWNQMACLLVALAILAPVALGKVYLRWTQTTVPPPKVLGANELVIPWSEDAQSLATTVEKQGYRAYFEVPLAQATVAAQAAANSGVSGIFIKSSTAAEEAELGADAEKLRTKYPKLKILVVSANGKQPQMKGWLVFQRNGILQVSSPTSQPWLDQNLATVRHERAFETAQRPTYTFEWDVSDPLVKQNGPKPADYALAVVEAGAFHADLILELHEVQQKGLASGESSVVAAWEPVKRTIAFYDRSGDGEQEASEVAVLTNDYDSSYEAINLMARHNIPFRVLHSDDVKPADLAGLDVLIAFAAPKQGLIGEIQSFANRGGVAVLVNLPGTYPWRSSSTGKTSGQSVTYTVGNGRVIELQEPVSDPETFAQDVRRLMVKEQVPVSLWNSLTTLVVEYPEKNGEATVELVNYDEEPTPVQVQVKGAYGSVRYESPEKGCCETLKPEQGNGFTQFVVPDLLVGGRVHLAKTNVTK